MNGEELHELCQDTSEVCIGYITAVADALESLKWPAPSTCRPKDVELEEILDFAMNVLADYQTELRRPAINIMSDAFADRWPC